MKRYCSNGGSPQTANDDIMSTYREQKSCDCRFYVISVASHGMYTCLHDVAHWRYSQQASYCRLLYAYVNGKYNAIAFNGGHNVINWDGHVTYFLSPHTVALAQQWWAQWHAMPAPIPWLLKKSILFALANQIIKLRLSFLLIFTRVS